MAVDVTESEKLSERLLREAHFRRKLTESCHGCSGGGEASGTINIFNPAAEALFGVNSLDVIGKKQISDFLPEEFLRNDARR